VQSAAKFLFFSFLLAFLFFFFFFLESWNLELLKLTPADSSPAAAAADSVLLCVEMYSR
jgi:amino acid permease